MERQAQNCERKASLKKHIFYTSTGIRHITK
jgi:hypothetical protein